MTYYLYLPSCRWAQVEGWKQVKIAKLHSIFYVINSKQNDLHYKVIDKCRNYYIHHFKQPIIKSAMARA